jgi:hypothetical protein
MKKTLFALAALLLSFFVADADNTVVKTFKMDGFSGIQADDAFEIIVEHSDSYKIEVELTEDFVPYLVVRNRAGILELGFSKLPLKLKQKDRKKVAKAIIKMPELHYVGLSGASTLKSNDEFTSPMQSFSIELSGGSDITNLNINAPDVTVKLSGASKAIVSFRSSDVKADLTGASRLDVVGRTEDFFVHANGASKVNAEAFEAQNVDAKVAGASRVNVCPVRELSVELAGASKCEYYGNSEELNIKSEKIGGASTLKKHK